MSNQICPLKNVEEFFFLIFFQKYFFQTWRPPGPQKNTPLA